jgi:quinol monooxygenase YgiN
MIEDPTKKRDEALRNFKSITKQCIYKPGSLSCHIYGDLQENNVFLLNEVWRSEEDLNLHLRSASYLNLLVVTEMSLKQPEIRFHTISSSSGIETIEKARNNIR